ncbi:hypothetical protein [Clostridium perfringens]|uniref:Uncharacterized protein n=1 Tax=Clostridium perfringens TaxID=1502 RepID=A0A140GRJ7_CLOPF|nr:hypothetical protein [Clostridium perfringens]AMN31156.1 hypothetical protein JFP838_pA0240 [Clostridium perfringens]
MSKKYIIIEMSDNSVWEIPASIIAENRAKYYETKDENYNDIFQETLDDEELLIDWAENNLSWQEVFPHSKCIKQPQVDYSDDWHNGEKNIEER